LFNRLSAGQEIPRLL